MRLERAVEVYLDSVKTCCPEVTGPELEYIKQGLALMELKPKDVYIEPETVQREIGFVVSGLLRVFYNDESGKEISVNFIREGGYATHYSSFIAQTPCRYCIQCVESSLLVTLPYAHIQEGYRRFPGLERYGRLVAEEVLKMQQRRIEGFIFGNAESRYLSFVRENPALLNRVSVSHLASFLGIERQSLTRIRKRLVTS
jgi:CRP-like cAMP-binding protein